MGRKKITPVSKIAQVALKQVCQEDPHADLDDSHYGLFDQLNGQHPWMDIMPEGHITYQVRELGRGSVAYFNFELAKEMGLIPQNHPHKINKKLEQKIIETFSLRIINEYDQENKIYFPKNKIKPNKYMATRYLQLQHNNKQGVTSGDGRAIWNGVLIHNDKMWDLSSRGTGVTCLAPGAVAAGEPLKSGNTDFGYGCGLAEIDELYSASMMAEIFYKNGLNTERVLCVIDLGGGIGIGVRANPNLLRPAHLFMYLKQNNYEALKRATDYLILRQVKNQEWNFSANSFNRYDLMLEQICDSYAKFAAILEREYIFAWLDWDGDNVLANAGIIDYGSVRQFGLRHDQYRYDDVERFSTNLNEQQVKARLIVQVFAQLTDYLNTKNKKTLKYFKTAKILKKFDKKFEYYSLDHLLYQMGFNEKQRKKLLTKNISAVKSFFRDYTTLEKIKTVQKSKKVADGINRPAILNMRKLCRLVINFYSNLDGPLDSRRMPLKDLFQKILSLSATNEDSRLTTEIAQKLIKIQDKIKYLIKQSCEAKYLNKNITEIKERINLINKDDRVTGNALLHIVHEMMTQRKRGLKHSEIQKVIDNFIESQVTSPTTNSSPGNKHRIINNQSKKLVQTILTIVDGHKEDI